MPQCHAHFDCHVSVSVRPKYEAHVKPCGGAGVWLGSFRDPHHGYWDNGLSQHVVSHTAQHQRMDSTATVTDDGDGDEVRARPLHKSVIVASAEPGHCIQVAATPLSQRSCDALNALRV